MHQVMVACVDSAGRRATVIWSGVCRWSLSSASYNDYRFLSGEYIDHCRETVTRLLTVNCVSLSTSDCCITRTDREGERETERGQQ